MLESVALDFLDIRHIELVVPHDQRLTPPDLPCRFLPIRSAGHERAQLAKIAAEADWTLLIAPEFDRHLQSRSEWILELSGRLLSPDPDFIALTADKYQLNCRLHALGAPVPNGCLLQPRERPPSHWSYPLIRKPRYGAGSGDIATIACESELHQDVGGEVYVEQFCPGWAASVAALCGPRRQRLLPACQQRLSDDGRFKYLGGCLPMPAHLDERARRVARSVLRHLPQTTGYIGCDIVLGNDPSGADDRLIEVNPRITTSYVGLRQISEVNLAEAMIAVAKGSQVELSFRAEPLEFRV